MGMRYRLAAAVAALLVAPALPARAGTLAVTIFGIGEARGMIRVIVCNRAEFGTEICGGRAAIPARGPSVVLTFPDLMPGQYAIKAFHDVNGNQKLDTNLVGMPTEAYGFSRDARQPFGPPSFDDAAVTLGAAPLNVAVRLR